jgi:quinol monooxygenase YgiN
MMAILRKAIGNSRIEWEVLGRALSANAANGQATLNTYATGWCSLRGMIIITGNLRVSPDDPKRFYIQITDHCEAVRALDGCIHKSISVDMADPALWWVCERWANKDAQAVHLASENMARFNVMMNHARLQAGNLMSFETEDSGSWMIRS